MKKLISDGGGGSLAIVAGKLFAIQIKIASPEHGVSCRRSSTGKRPSLKIQLYKAGKFSLLQNLIKKLHVA